VRPDDHTTWSPCTPLVGHATEIQGSTFPAQRTEKPISRSSTGPGPLWGLLRVDLVSGVCTPEPMLRVLAFMGCGWPLGGQISMSTDVQGQPLVVWPELGGEEKGNRL
jgi:hypothetical protein